MKSLDLKKLLDSREPIAIVRYFEWVVFSTSYSQAKYSLLRLNKQRNKIKEIPVPDKLTFLLTSRLDSFEKVCVADGGTVWERMSFRDVVKTLVPRDKVAEWINKQ